MFPKAHISLVLATFLGVTGCFENGGTGSNGNPDYKIDNPAYDGRTWPLFNPVTSELPLPNDLIFDSEAGDGTFSVTDTSPPVTTTLNSLSGASTVAPPVITFSGRIDPGSVDARSFVMSGGQPVPNPEQNVFLIELDYASGDPLRALSTGEPPTLPLAVKTASAFSGDSEAAAQLTELASSPDYEAEIVRLDGQSAIRINPLRPLKPGTRYIVAVTNEVLDINGEPVIQSVSYSNLTDEDQPLPTSLLAPVRTVINSLWEPVAASYFALTNSSRSAGTELTENNIAVSFSFTTSNDEKVLQYIAEPQAWFSDQLTSFLRSSAAASTVENQSDLNSDGTVDYSDILIAADGAVAAFPGTGTETALAAIFATAPPSGCSGLTGQTAIDCVGYALANTPSSSGGFADLLPTPAARTVSLDVAGTSDAALTSAVVSQVVDAGSVNIVQGTIELPYYLGLPNVSDGSPLVTGFWNADNTLATALNTAFSALGLTLPQADESVSDAGELYLPLPGTDRNGGRAGTGSLPV